MRASAPGTVQSPRMSKRAAKQLHHKAHCQQRRRQRPTIVGEQLRAFAEIEEVAHAGDKKKSPENHAAENHQCGRTDQRLPSLPLRFASCPWNVRAFDSSIE